MVQFGWFGCYIRFGSDTLVAWYGSAQVVPQTMLEKNECMWHRESGKQHHNIRNAIHIYIYTYKCMAVSRLLWFAKVTGAQEVPKRKIKNEIGNQTAKGLFDELVRRNWSSRSEYWYFDIEKYLRMQKNTKKRPQTLYIFLLICNYPYWISYYLQTQEKLPYICIYIHMYIHTYVCTYIYLCIYTHT